MSELVVPLKLDTYKKACLGNLSPLPFKFSVLVIFVFRNQYWNAT